MCASVFDTGLKKVYFSAPTYTIYLTTSRTYATTSILMIHLWLVGLLVS
jgi:hypothetical protein